MRFDIQNQLSAAQAFTGGSTVSTNSYDLGSYTANGQTQAPDPSIGRQMAVLGLVTVAAGAGSTWTHNAINTTDAALTAGVLTLVTVTLTAALMPAGQQVILPIPQKSISERYIGYSNSGTGGTVTVTMDVYWMPLDEIPAFKSFIKVVDAKV